VYNRQHEATITPSDFRVPKPGLAGGQSAGARPGNRTGESRPDRPKSGTAAGRAYAPSKGTGAAIQPVSTTAETGAKEYRSQARIAKTEGDLMYTRRDFAKIAMAGVPLGIVLGAGKINSTIGGVMLGAQSYSFRDLPLDGCIQAMAEIGLGECELYSPHTEPKGSREELRKWRLSAPLDEMKAVRKKFTDAGINLCAYNLSFKDDFTDDEIERGFQMAEALGVNVITASSTLTVAKRLVPFVEKHNKMTVAFHGHADIDKPNEFAKPESFAAAMAMSKQFAVNLDI
jgi:hypothetical protein